MANKVLFATDFSESSGKAFEQAIKIAKLTSAELVIGHILHFPPMMTDLPAQVEETEEAMRRWCRHRLDELASRAASEGVRCQTALPEGAHAHAGIARLAEELGVLMVVLGTHGRTGVSKLVLGSVAARLIAEAPCPVLVVRG